MILIDLSYKAVEWLITDAMPVIFSTCCFANSVNTLECVISKQICLNNAGHFFTLK